MFFQNSQPSLLSPHGKATRKALDSVLHGSSATADFRFRNAWPWTSSGNCRSHSFTILLIFRSYWHGLQIGHAPALPFILSNCALILAQSLYSDLMSWGCLHEWRWMMENLGFELHCNHSSSFGLGEVDWLQPTSKRRAKTNFFITRSNFWIILWGNLPLSARIPCISKLSLSPPAHLASLSTPQMKT